MPVVALTPNLEVYHRLNLVWGIRPVLFKYDGLTLEQLLQEMEAVLLERNFVMKGDQVLVLGGLPLRQTRSTSFLNIHTIGEEN